MTDGKEKYKFDLGVKGVNTNCLLVKMQSLFGWRDTERLCTTGAAVSVSCLLRTNL